MYSVSDDFKIAVRYSHQIITRAEVLRDGQQIAVIYPETGTVEIDQRRAVRRTMSLALHAGERTISYTPTYNTYSNLSAAYASYTAAKNAIPTYGDSQVITGETATTSDDGLVPANPLSTLTPYGNEIRLYRGLRYRKASSYTYGTLSSSFATYSALTAAVASYATFSTLTANNATTIDEYVPLGVFPITQVSINQDDNGIAIDISGDDRSRIISDNRWIDPYQIASGTNVATALTALLQDRYADVQLRFTDTSATTAAITLGLDSENDPWADAVDIAEAAGLDLFFDQEGACVLRPKDDYSVAASVEAYNEDTEAMILTTGRTLTRDEVYNTVIVTAEGTDTNVPFRSVAIDNDPASPTYVFGPLGSKPTFISSSLINSQASADAFAAATLNDLRGIDENIAWTQIVDPSLDAGDVVSIVNVSAKIARALVLDKLTIPLSPEEAMSAQGRTILYAVGDSVVTAGGEVVATNVTDTSSTGIGSGDSSSIGGIIRTQAIR